MEILVILVVVVVVMLIAARFDNATGASARTADGDAKNYSGLDDDWSTNPMNSFMVGNIWHEDD